jgi:hypothetical protein
MATTSTATPTNGSRTRSPRRTRVLAVAGAALAALAGWAIADPVAGVDLTVRQGPDATPQEVGPAAVVLVSVLAGLAAWAALAVLERISASAGRDWTILAGVVLVLSLTGPIAAATTTTGKAALAGMHLVVAAVLVPLLARSTRA